MTLEELITFLDKGSRFKLYETNEDDDIMVADITKGHDQVPSEYSDRRVILVDISEIYPVVSVFVSREAAHS